MGWLLLPVLRIGTEFAIEIATRNFSQAEVEAIIEGYQRSLEDRPLVDMDDHMKQMAERGYVADKA